MKVIIAILSIFIAILCVIEALIQLPKMIKERFRENHS